VTKEKMVIVSGYFNPIHKRPYRISLKVESVWPQTLCYC
jgi:hypothetical protein